MISRKEVEDRIVRILREEYLKHSNETLEKYEPQIKSTVRWYVSSLPRHIAGSEAHDLEAEAKMAFLDCLKTWDPRRGELWSYVSAMRDFEEKEKAVIEKYYKEDKTFKEIGVEIGLSESQVSRICKDATVKL